MTELYWRMKKGSEFEFIFKSFQVFFYQERHMTNTVCVCDMRTTHNLMLHLINSTIHLSYLWSLFKYALQSVTTHDIPGFKRNALCRYSNVHCSLKEFRRPTSIITKTKQKLEVCWMCCRCYLWMIGVFLPLRHNGRKKASASIHEFLSFRWSQVLYLYAYS